jgi:hypothetical protein
MFIGMVDGRSSSLHTALEESSNEDGAISGTEGSFGSLDPEGATW